MASPDRRENSADQSPDITSKQISRRQLLKDGGLALVGVGGAVGLVGGVPAFVLGMYKLSKIEGKASSEVAVLMPDAPSESQVEEARMDLNILSTTTARDFTQPGVLETVTTLTSSQDVFDARRVIEEDRKRIELELKIADDYGADTWGATAIAGMIAIPVGTVVFVTSCIIAAVEETASASVTQNGEVLSPA